MSDVEKLDQALSVEKPTSQYKMKISTETSKIPVYVVPTNEELMIAKETYELVK